MSLLAARLGGAEAEVVVRQGRAQRTVNDKGLSRAIERAFGLSQRIRELEAEMLESRAHIARRAADLSGGGSTITLSAGGVACTVTRRFEAQVPEGNLAALKKILGRRFRELVNVRTRHTAGRQLIKEAPAGALELLRLRELSPQFRWSGRGMAGDGENGRKK